jgi:putative membrane protein
MTTEVHGGLHSWAFPIPVTLALIAVVLAYTRGWYQLRDAFPNLLSIWRLAAFMGGVLSVWAVVGSPLSVLDHQLLTIHMVQHLLLMTVAAPLILLGAPVITLLQALPQAFVRRFSAHGIGRVSIHPVFCWLASTVVVIGWHVPAMFEMAMQSQWLHQVEHASFFAAGLLFWWPVVQPWPSTATWPRWSVPLYLFLATLPCDALSAFLTFCDRVVYPHYLTGHQVFDISPLVDQERAGALMWVWVTFVYLVPTGVIAIQMLSPPTRASRVKVV